MFSVAQQLAALRHWLYTASTLLGRTLCCAANGETQLAGLNPILVLFVVQYNCITEDGHKTTTTTTLFAKSYCLQYFSPPAKSLAIRGHVATAVVLVVLNAGFYKKKNENVLLR